MLPRPVAPMTVSPKKQPPPMPRYAEPMAEPGAVARLPRRRRRRWPAYIVGLVILLVVLWFGYWFGAMRVADYAIARATAAPIGGHSIGCPDHSLSGFPLRVDVRCQRVTYANASDSLAAALGGVWASAPLYRPGFVEATLDAPLQVDMPDRGLALTASWSAATATANAWLDGLSGGSAHFEALTLKNGGRADALPVTSATAQSADGGLSAAGGGNYRITADAEHLDVKRSDGGPLPVLDLRASLLAQNVGSLGTDPMAALLKWARSGANLKIDDLRIAASGAVVTASGALSLNKDGLLNGSILLGYNNIDALGNLIEVFRPGAKAKYAEPLKIVNSLTRAVKTPEGDFRQTSITFTDGVIWLAIFPLIGVDPIPPIKF
jgi:hypothetical protein